MRVLEQDVKDMFEEIMTLFTKCKAQYGLACIENARLKHEIDILKAKIKIYESKYNK